MSNETIGCIGFGSMGSALVNGITSSGDLASATIVQRTSKEGPSIAEMLKSASVIILAVKPQIYYGSVEAEIAAAGGATCPVISVMAGVSLERLRQVCSGPLCRAMPNTPVSIGKGSIVYMTQDGEASASGEPGMSFPPALIAGMGACGTLVEVHREDLVDAGTGVTGSGAGFLLLMMEAWMDAAVQAGFQRGQAETLVRSLFSGTAALVEEHSDIHIAALRNKVTSPGGTTAAGLHSLEQAGVRAAIASAVVASAEKAAKFATAAPPPNYDVGARDAAEGSKTAKAKAKAKKTRKL